MDEAEAGPVLEALARLSEQQPRVPFEELLAAVDLKEFELRRRLQALFMAGRVKMPTAFSCEWIELP